jgi:hypothetical protein
LETPKTGSENNHVFALKKENLFQASTFGPIKRLETDFDDERQ